MDSMTVFKSCYLDWRTGGLEDLMARRLEHQRTSATDDLMT